MKNYTTKVSQWAETYRSATDEEIKAAIRTFFNMEYWHDLHVALWAWLCLDGEREKSEWFKKFDVPEVRSNCFACKVAKKCFNCPLPRKETRGVECANGLYEKWVSTHKIAEREKLAREIATMKWEERL